MKLDIPNNWSHDFKISKSGKFITLIVNVDFNLQGQLGHRAKRFTINGLFNCYSFKDRKIEQKFFCCWNR